MANTLLLLSLTTPAPQLEKLALAKGGIQRRLGVGPPRQLGATRTVTPDTGVCYTRNLVANHAPLALWAELHASAATLRLANHHAIRSCLFTDAPRADVDEAMRRWSSKRPGLAPAHSLAKYGAAATNGSLFDLVLPTSDPLELVRARRDAAEFERLFAHTRTMSFRDKSTLERKLLSRVGRILNLARAPFTVTLFLDDDTVFCPSALNGRFLPLAASATARRRFPRRIDSLRNVLVASASAHGLAHVPSARLVELHLWKTSREKGFDATREHGRLERVSLCATETPGCDKCSASRWADGGLCEQCLVECEDRIGMQRVPGAVCPPFVQAASATGRRSLNLAGGAILINRLEAARDGASLFAASWVDAYLSFWIDDWEAKVASRGKGFAKDQGPLGEMVGSKALAAWARVKMNESRREVQMPSDWEVAPLYAGLNRKVMGSSDPSKEKSLGRTYVLHHHGAYEVFGQLHGLEKTCRAINAPA